MKVPTTIETRIAHLEKTIAHCEEMIAMARQELAPLQWAANQIINEGGEPVATPYPIATAKREEILRDLRQNGPSTPRELKSRLGDFGGSLFGQLSRADKINKLSNGKWAAV